jgi:hypothetical protein
MQLHRYGALACAAKPAQKHKKKGFGQPRTLATTHPVIMNHFEPPCASEGIPVCVPVYMTGLTGTQPGNETPPAAVVSAETEIISAVNVLKSHGWSWEPTDPGRWGLFPIVKWPTAARANG